MAFAAAAVLGCGKETPADTTGDGINPPPLPDETDVCSGIEDEAFKEYCLANFDTDKDRKISPREAELVKTIGCDGLDIVTFTGIEHFKNLETFSCANNEYVRSIDLHYNTKLANIPKDAFRFCLGLEKIVLPPNLTSIADGAFFICENLAGFYGNLASEDNRSLVLNGRLVGFAPAGLTEYAIPDNVTAIGANVICILECELEKITIPYSVTSFADGVFAGLLNLKAIYGRFASADKRCLTVDGKLLAFAPSGLTEYSIPEGVTEIGAGVFYGCANLSDIDIPDGVTSIGKGAFYCCESLKDITLGEKVANIEDHAFLYCSGLESVTIKATTPPALGSRAFDAGSDLGDGFSINVPKSAVDAYRTAEGWKDYAEYIRGM